MKIYPFATSVDEAITVPDDEMLRGAAERLSQVPFSEMRGSARLALDLSAETKRASALEQIIISLVAANETEPWAG